MGQMLTNNGFGFDFNFQLRCHQSRDFNQC